MEAAQVVVFGAGAFGGWTALELLRRGARVRLIDAWGPGNARASSGGETRVIRATYGSHEIYTAMAARALRLWRAHEERFQQQLLRITGALWMFERDDPFVGDFLVCASKAWPHAPLSERRRCAAALSANRLHGDLVSALRAGGWLSVRTPRVRTRREGIRCRGRRVRRGCGGRACDPRRPGARDPIERWLGTRGGRVRVRLRSVARIALS